MGNMENEGFTFWNINSAWEFFDDSVAFRGERSIGQIRESGMGDNVVTNFEKRLLVHPEKEYTIHGWMKTENGADVTLEIRCYASRTGGNILVTESLFHVNGDTEWNYYHKDVILTEETRFIDYRLSSNVPEDGTAYSWFDDAGLIEWGEWKSISENMIDAPNDFSFIQLKNPESLLGTEIYYIETVFEDIPIPVPDFSADVINGDFPLTVQFTDISTGVITYRDWGFGDGTTTDEADPTHEYSVPGSYSVSLTIPDFDGNEITLLRENYIQVSDTMFVQVDFIEDWNLVGLPSVVLNEHVETIFPEAIEGTLFRFDESYFLDSLLEAGSGYWLRFENGGIQPIQGTPLDSLTLQLTEGWNLISGIGTSIPIEAVQDPENILVPNTFFGFNFGYFDAEFVEQGKGYWIRTFDEGTITFNEGENRQKQKKNSIDFEYSGWIESGNLKLYFGLESLEEADFSCSMPPLPPDDAFDIRFEDNLRCAEDSTLIHFQHSPSPVQFNYELDPGEHWVIKFENGDKIDLIKNGTFMINNPLESIHLLKSPPVPEMFNLYQNFPNPFNNKTVIKYDLPNSEKVQLSIFDIRGNLINTLINREIPAGFHRFEWNGMNEFGNPVSTGVYFIRFETQSYSQSRKMLLLK
jgi:PKD repeat protein